MNEPERIGPPHTVWIDLPGEPAVKLEAVGPDHEGPTMLLHWSSEGVAALHLGEPYESPDGWM